MNSRELQQVLRGAQVGTVSFAAIIAMNVLFSEGWDAVCTYLCIYMYIYIYIYILLCLMVTYTMPSV